MTDSIGCAHRASAAAIAPALLRRKACGAALRVATAARAPALRWWWKLVPGAGFDACVKRIFLLLIAFAAFSDLVTGHDVAATVRDTLLILAVLTTEVLHEFGHALTASASVDAVRPAQAPGWVEE